MAIPDYVELTDAEIAIGKGIRSSFGRIVKDNLINHQARLDGIEQSARLFDHFNRPIEYFRTEGDYSFPIARANGNAGTILAGEFSYDGRWFFAGTRGSSSTYTATSANGNALKPSASEVAMTVPGAGVNVRVWSRAMSALGFPVAQTTLPILFEVRGRWNDTRIASEQGTAIGDKLLYVGMLDNLLLSEGSTPEYLNRTGVWLDRHSADRWRFVMYDGAVKTLGANDFPRTGDNNDFEVRIEYTDTPTNRIICEMDTGDGNGMQIRETFTDNLPASGTLRAMIGIGNPNLSQFSQSGRVSFDRALFSAGAVTDVNP